VVGPELFGAYGNAQAAGIISLITLERFGDEVLGLVGWPLGHAPGRYAHEASDLLVGSGAYAAVVRLPGS
jgi:hypothetical protein